jgi:hypothetical protein
MNDAVFNKKPSHSWKAYINKQEAVAGVFANDFSYLPGNDIHSGSKT